MYYTHTCIIQREFTRARHLCSIKMEILSTKNTKNSGVLTYMSEKHRCVSKKQRTKLPVCSVVLGHGSLTCTIHVTYARHFLLGLPQGGLAVLYKLLFKGPETFLRKVKKLVLVMAAQGEEPFSKRRKVDSNSNHDDHPNW